MPPLPTADALDGALILEELDALLGSVGAEGLVEFGVDADAESVPGASPWAYDASARVLALRADRVGAVWRAARSAPDAAGSSAATLLLSGDDYSAWNRRKRTLLGAGDGADRGAELAFNAVVLRRHAKAASAWSHRKWLLARENGGKTLEDAAASLELALCTSLAFRFPRNYYAWCHRAWVARRCWKQSPVERPARDIFELLCLAQIELVFHDS